MEIAYIINSILQSFAISLGVGSSTIAITQFFSAIRDGQIDETERRMMGVVYILLRVAMVAILLTALVQTSVLYYVIGEFSFLSPYFFAVWTVVAVLFLNAIGMTLRLVPSAFGPGIQAGSWYSLGVLYALVPLGLTSFAYLQFILAYAGTIFLALAIVNGVMRHLRN